MAWIMYRNRLDIYSVIASILCLIGIGFLPKGRQRNKPGGSSDPGLRILLCRAYNNAGALVRSGRILRFNRNPNAYHRFLALVCALLFESFPSQISRETYGSMLYIIAVCTLFCFSIQTIAQKYTTASHTSIILCLEAVFGSIFAIIFHGDVFTPTMLVGCLLILIGIIIAETKLEFLHGRLVAGKTLSN